MFTSSSRWNEAWDPSFSQTAMTDWPVVSSKLRLLADGGHSRADELRAAADRLDAVIEGYYAEPPTVDGGTYFRVWKEALNLWWDASSDDTRS